MSQPRHNLCGPCWMLFCLAVMHTLGSYRQVPPSQAQGFIELLRVFSTVPGAGEQRELSEMVPVLRSL